jgi:hypothetical protein
MFFMTTSVSHNSATNVARSVAAAALVALSSLVVATLGATLSATPAAAEGTLEGSWSGGGNVRFNSGKSERASCRANFSKRGGSSYSMSATCATSSGRVTQTAQLTRSGANRFSGDFQNNEYGVSGSINISVNGNSLNASLNGGGASANFNLNR